MDRSIKSRGKDEPYSNDFVINISFWFNETSTTDNIGIGLSFSQRKTNQQQEPNFEHLLFSTNDCKESEKNWLANSVTINVDKIASIEDNDYCPLSIAYSSSEKKQQIFLRRMTKAVKEEQEKNFSSPFLRFFFCTDCFIF